MGKTLYILRKNGICSFWPLLFPLFEITRFLYLFTLRKLLNEIALTLCLNFTLRRFQDYDFSLCLKLNPTKFFRSKLVITLLFIKKKKKKNFITLLILRSPKAHLWSILFESDLQSPTFLLGKSRWIATYLMCFPSMLWPVWYPCLSNNFHISNTLTHISTYFFTHTYFKKLQKSHLKLLYQTPPNIWIILSLVCVSKKQLIICVMIIYIYIYMIGQKPINPLW